MQLKFALIVSLAACCLFCAAMFAPRAAISPTISPISQSGVDPHNPRFIVERGKRPNIRLRPRPATTAAEVAEIRRLITSLSQITEPDFGLSPTISGSAFLPIEGMTQANAFILTDHRLKTFAALRKLIELGPQSLPFLLDALDDQTPTKLPEEHAMAMWFANELPMSSNPNNVAESKVLPRRTKTFIPQQKYVKGYTVKVGDVCLVAIGQIVGRPYSAVRYQPTLCIVINSPTHDAELRRQVREIWASDNPRERLFESLLVDYTTGLNPSRSEIWSETTKFQTKAALRLLYYFPQEAASMIAERLDLFKVSRTGQGRGSILTEAEVGASAEQWLANAVDADEFVKAVAWSHEPEIKEALFRVFQRAADLDVLLNTLPSVAAGHQDLVRRRLTGLLDELPEETQGPYGDGYHLLVALGQYGDEADKATFARFRDRKSVMNRHSLCLALREVRRAWAIDLLAPLLSDRRKANGWDYENYLLGICDEAAKTISLANPEFKFELGGPPNDLDRQIGDMKRQIAARKK